MRFSVIVPTLNPGSVWNEFVDALGRQTLKPAKILVVDSSSQDDTVAISRKAGFDVAAIEKDEFNHGATRQLAINLLEEMDVYVFLTQDAILANKDSLKNIVTSFKDSHVGLAYGRQLPRREAGLIESHARYFNYPDESCIRSWHDKNDLGMKAVFTSNSFAAYRGKALADIGGFPSDTIVSEDMFVAAKMLIDGWKIAYCADAQVYHSHGYGMVQEFQRYFDIGVFNSSQAWIRKEFGSAESEGRKFMKSEMYFLLKNNPLLIPQAIMRSLVKFAGYRLGVNQSLVPKKLRLLFSMQKGYWKS